MKHSFYYITCLLLLSFTAGAQMKIGDNPASINAASLLELESTNKGFVFPKVGLTSLSSPSPLPAGLLTGTFVFNTASNVGSGIGLYYWNGSAWVAVNSVGGSGSGWLLTGNTNTNSSTNFVGTIDDRALVFKVNNTIAGFLGGQNDGQGKTSFGYSANAGDQNATAIGREAVATANTASAFGYQAQAGSQYAIAIGPVAKATSTSAIAIGQGSLGSAQNGIAIGNNALATSNVDNIAIGTQAAASVQQGIAIGAYAKANQNLTAMALGYTATAGGQSSTAIGDHATASGQSSLAFGVSASSGGNISIAVGNQAAASGAGSAAFGAVAKAEGLNSTALGNGAEASLGNGLAVGNQTKATALGAIAIGNSSQGTGINSMVMGLSSTAASFRATVLGNNSTVNTASDSSIIVGDFSTITGKNSIILGNNSTTTGNRATVIGNDINTSANDVLILGNSNKKIGIGTTNPQSKVDIIPPQGVNPLFIAGVPQITSPGLNDSVLIINAGVVKKYKANLESDLPTAWYTTGNIGTISSEFLGTTDNKSLRVRTNNIQRMLVDSLGNIVIGKGDNTDEPLGNVFRAPNANPASTNIVGGSLTVQGGIASGTATGGGLTLLGGASAAGSQGDVNIQGTSVKNKLGKNGRFLVLNSGTPGVDEYVKLLIAETGEVNWYLDGQDMFVRDGFFDAFGDGKLYKYDFMHISGNTGRIGFNILDGYSDGSPGGETNLPLTSSVTLLGSIATKVRLLDGSSNYAIKQDDHIMIIDKTTNTNSDMVLPPVAISRGREYIFKRNDQNSGKIIVKPTAGEKLNGLVNYTITLGHENSTLEVVCGPDSWWVTSELAVTTSATWNLIGNDSVNSDSDFLGTINNADLRIRTNNVQRMLVDTAGSVGIGSSAFDAFNREKLLVDYGTTTSNTVANFKGSVNSYLQLNVQNTNNGNSASSDIVVTADDGTDTSNYVNLGINSSDYVAGAIKGGGPHDAYMYSHSRNLVIGTHLPTSDLIFLIGGRDPKTNAVMRINGPAGNIVIGRGDNTDTPVGTIIRGPNGNGTDIAGGSLTLRGGRGTGSADGGDLYLFGGRSELGKRGAVNISGDVISLTSPSLSISGVQPTASLATDSVLTVFDGSLKKAPYASVFPVLKNLLTVILPTLGNNSGANLDLTVPDVPYVAGGPNPVVAVNPEVDLPEGLIIAWVRVVATNTVRIHFRNVTNTTIPSQPIEFDVSVIK